MLEINFVMITGVGRVEAQQKPSQAEGKEVDTGKVPVGHRTLELGIFPGLR
jgi:hypothetical protein